MVSQECFTFESSSTGVTHQHCSPVDLCVSFKFGVGREVFSAVLALIRRGGLVGEAVFSEGGSSTEAEPTQCTRIRALA